jgi:hypothetical protein
LPVRVVDTTGIDATADEVIQIASVDVQKDGTIANRQEVLARRSQCRPRPRPCITCSTRT